MLSSNIKVSCKDRKDEEEKKKMKRDAEGNGFFSLKFFVLQKLFATLDNQISDTLPESRLSLEMVKVYEGEGSFIQTLASAIF